MQVVFVFPQSKIDTVPCLRAAVGSFRSAGYTVALLCPRGREYVQPRWNDPGVSTYWPTVPAAAPRWHRAVKWGVWHASVRASLLKTGPTACVIGVDPRGLHQARSLARWLNAPLAYWSLEILFNSEILDDHWRTAKTRERKAASASDLFIVQDEERAACLLRETGCSSKRVFTVPNSPAGIAIRRRSNYLRDKLRIPPDDKIVLSSGSLSTWACVHQLARSTFDWPPGWTLVFHSRQSVGHSDYLAAVRAMTDPKRVRFSLEPLESDAYEDLVRSADVGLACYCEKEDSIYTQRNIRHIGFSSGKALHYLREGIPVVYNSGGLFHEIMSKYGSGVQIAEPTYTRDALNAVLSNHAAFSRAAVRCFNEKLRFDSAFADVLAWLSANSRPSDKRQ